MKYYTYKTTPQEWDVIYNPELDVLMLTPRSAHKFYDFYGWYYIGEL